MTHRPALLPLLALALLLAQCHKDTPAPDPASQLPPATQTGAGTFGCLVNGQLYVPNSNTTLTSYYTLSYDPTFNGGSLDILTKNLGDRRRSLIMHGERVATVGDFSLSTQGDSGIHYTDKNLSPNVIGPCDSYSSTDAATYCRGKLTITKLDLQAGIVAGTFACMLWRAGCDSIRLTQGRFDYKL